MDKWFFTKLQGQLSGESSLFKKWLEQLNDHTQKMTMDP